METNMIAQTKTFTSDPVCWEPDKGLEKEFFQPTNAPSGDWVANCLPRNLPQYGNQWRKRYEVGAPKGTPKCTANELLLKGYVGLYFRKPTWSESNSPVQSSSSAATATSSQAASK